MALISNKVSLRSSGFWRLLDFPPSETVTSILTASRTSQASLHTAILGESSKPLQFAAGSASPSDPYPRRLDVDARAERVLQLSTSDDVDAELLSCPKRCEYSGVGRDNIASVFYTPNTQSLYGTSYLIVHASRSPGRRTFKLNSPAQASKSSPLAINVTGSYQFNYVDSTDPDRQLSFQLEEGGTVTHVVEISEFVEVRGSLNGSVYICAPASVDVTVGEEEIEQPDEIESESPSEAPIAETLGTEKLVSNYDYSTPALSDYDAESEPAEQPESFKPNDGVQAEWSLLDAIGHFFLAILNLFIAPFQTTPSIQLPRQDNEPLLPNQHASDQASEDEAPETQTPADEATPPLISVSYLSLSDRTILIHSSLRKCLKGLPPLHSPPTLLLSRTLQQKAPKTLRNRPVPCSSFFRQTEPRHLSLPRPFTSRQGTDPLLCPVQVSNPSPV